MKNNIQRVPLFLVLLGLISGCGGGGSEDQLPIQDGQINCATSSEPLHGCWVSMCARVGYVTEEVYAQYVMNFDTANKLKINLRTFTNSQCSGNNFRLSVVNDQSYRIGAKMLDDGVFLEKNLDIILPEINGSIELYSRYGIKADIQLCFPDMEFNWSGLGGFSPLATEKIFRPVSIDYTVENCLSRLIE